MNVFLLVHIDQRPDGPCPVVLGVFPADEIARAAIGEHAGHSPSCCAVEAWEVRETPDYPEPSTNGNT